MHFEFVILFYNKLLNEIDIRYVFHNKQYVYQNEFNICYTKLTWQQAKCQAKVVQKRMNLIELKNILTVILSQDLSIQEVQLIEAHATQMRMTWKRVSYNWVIVGIIGFALLLKKWCLNYSIFDN